MNLKNIHKVESVRKTLIILGIVVFALIIFEAGQTVGYRKARFTCDFERNFLGPKNAPGNMLFSAMPGGHGAVGEIVSAALPEFVIAGPDNMEKVVYVDDNTAVRRFRDEITVQDLKVGEFVVVLGNPNSSGQVEAKLVQVIPPPEDGFTINRRR